MKTLTFKIRRVEISPYLCLEFKTIKMKVVVIETLDLEVVKFTISCISFPKERVEENYWFTPNGVCKVYTGGLHTLQMGDIVDETYKTLMGQGKKTHKDTDNFLVTVCN
jgi:hypothetical protein